MATAPAPGLAKLLEDQPSKIHNFAVSDSSGNSIGTDQVEGTWSRNNDTITWEGSDPAVTADSSVTAGRLQVYNDQSQTSSRIALIGHTGVSLSEGDTIIYTSIEISFSTSDD